MSFIIIRKDFSFSIPLVRRYGYIGDVTKTSERTMLLSILQALGFVMMPVADFCGGQIYKAGTLNSQTLSYS